MNRNGTVTLVEAGNLLGLSPITLRIQIRNGKLKGQKKGRDWFVTLHELDRYERDSKRKPPVLTGGSPEGLSSGSEQQ
jgi:hypothetical protein